MPPCGTPFQSICCLPDLDFRWHFRSHERGAAIRIDDLPRNPTGLLRAEKCHYVADIFRCTQASHRRPTTLVPIPDEILDWGWEAIQHAILRPSRTDRINRNSAFGYIYSEVTLHGFHGPL